MYLPLVLALSFCGVAQAVECYTSKGFPWTYNNDEPVEGWVPCNRTAAVTNCCSPRDYCMTNGLCMDAVIDNMMSQQGCTSSTWDARPCRNYCGDTDSDIAGLHFLWRCVGQSHCCSNQRNTTCCDDPGVKTFVVEVGQQMHMPDMVAVPLAAYNSYTSSLPKGSASALPSSGGSPSPTGTPPAGSTSSSNNSSSQSSSTALSDASAAGGLTQTATIGLAVGVSLGIVIAAALVFFGFQMRRKNKSTKTPEMEGDRSYIPPGTNGGLHPSSLYHGSFDQQGHGNMHPSQHMYSHNNQMSHGYPYGMDPQHMYTHDPKNRISPPPAELGERRAAELDGIR